MLKTVSLPTMKHGGFIWLKQWFLCHCPTLFHSMEENTTQTKQTSTKTEVNVREKEGETVDWGINS